jgi:serine/threonine-protein kinase 11
MATFERPLPFLRQVRSGFSSGSDEEPLRQRVKKVGPYFLLDKIGSGAIAKVYCALNPTNSTYYAIKKFCIHQLQHIQGGLSQMTRELAALLRFDHPNILGFEEILYDPKNGVVYLVLEYADCGSLDTWIGDSLPEGVVQSVFFQVLEGLHYIHGQGFVHQDIKPSNILLRSDGRAVISDFGVGHSFQSTDMVVGSPAFQAPELLSEVASKDPSKEDVWSIGVSLFQTLFHRCPFDGETVYEIIRSITQCQLVVPANCSNDLRQLLVGMLARDPQHRMSVRDAMDSPYFTGIDFEKLDFSQLRRKPPKLGLNADITEIEVEDRGHVLPTLPQEVTLPTLLRHMGSGSPSAS